MGPRSPHEPHRVSTPLELFFDLVFVVAISQAAAGLHHALTEDHIAAGVIGYALVFFAIWWAWVAFTWFASAYDADDVPYRLLVFVQLTGALILAAGVSTMLESRAPNLATIGGYVVMRVALVAQWLRAAASDPLRRVTAIRYAVGTTLVQALWVTLLFVPWPFVAAFAAFAALDLLVPAWAESAVPTPWHPHHIAERYGLMTIIVLGESILAATMATREAWLGGVSPAALLPIAGGGLLIVFSMWWLYFDRPTHDLLTSLRRAFAWAHGHYLVFASAAAVGAGLAASADATTHHGAIAVTSAGYAVAIPVAIFLASIATLNYRAEYRRTVWLVPVAVALILLTPSSGQAVPLTGGIMAALVAIKLAMRR